MPEKAVLANQLIILAGQILELKVEVALLKGKPVTEAIDDAFYFLECSPLFHELFDEEHVGLLRAEYQKRFEHSEMPN
ncbi:MAG: hypothetical protein M3511_04685 [Deinococcota bacterium]|jgi:hypothetical protein|nr:hypothetical protein [Deinococcota bacterium]